MKSSNSIEARSDFAFVYYLRVFAALLVVYDHFVGEYVVRTGLKSSTVGLLGEWLVEPLGIIQNFGALGVAIFFLVSGFVISNVSIVETRKEFLIRRIFRIFPAYWVAIGVAIMVGGGGAGLDFARVVKNMLLVNYLQVDQAVILGVAWTLVIEVIFYLLVACLINLLKVRPFAALLIEAALVLAVIATCRNFGAGWFLFAASVAYVPYLLIGQVIFFTYVRKLDPFRAIVLFVLSYLLAVYGLKLIHVEFLPISNSRLLQFFYALAIFLCCLGVERKIRLHPAVRAVANSSYSLYLLHGTLGLAVLAALHAIVGYWVAVAVALGISMVVSLVMFRFVEKPMIAIGANLLTARLSS